MKGVIRKQNHPDSIKCVSKDPLGDRYSGYSFIPGSGNNKHITNLLDLQALPLFQVFKNINFFSKTLTLLP